MQVNATPSYEIGAHLHMEWAEGEDTAYVEHYGLDDDERLTYWIDWEAQSTENGYYTARDLESLKAKVLHTDMTLILQCDYCGISGTVGEPDSTLEIKYHKFVCKDSVRCDKRWDENNREENDS